MKHSTYIYQRDTQELTSIDLSLIDFDQVERSVTSQNGASVALASPSLLIFPSLKGNKRPVTSVAPLQGVKTLQGKDKGYLNKKITYEDYCIIIDWCFGEAEAGIISHRNIESVVLDVTGVKIDRGAFETVLKHSTSLISKAAPSPFSSSLPSPSLSSLPSSSSFPTLSSLPYSSSSFLPSSSLPSSSFPSSSSLPSSSSVLCHPSRVGGQQNISVEVEGLLADNLKSLRSLKAPLFRDEIKAKANALIKGTVHAQHFRNGEVSNRWYYAFLSRNGFTTGNHRPHDITREQWCSAENLKKMYDGLKKAMLRANVAVVNNDYVRGGEGIKGQEIIITAPERIASMDETGVEGDMMSPGKARVGRQVFVTGDKANGVEKDSRQVVGFKGSARLTGVCGTFGTFQSVRPAFIFKGLSFLADHTVGGPTSTLIDRSTGSPFSAHFNATDTSAAKGDYMLTWIRETLLSHFTGANAPTAEKKLLLTFDGYDSHLTMAVLSFCIKNHIELFCRLPHSSSETQPEDVGTFSVFKPLFNAAKVKYFSEQFMSTGRKNLHNGDLIKILTVPWMVATAPDVTRAAWEKCGIVPFNRELQYKKEAEELRSESKKKGCSSSSNLKGVNMDAIANLPARRDLYLGKRKSDEKREQEQENSDDDDDEEKGYQSLTQSKVRRVRWDDTLGNVTSEEAIALYTAQEDARNKKKDETKVKQEKASEKKKANIVISRSIAATLISKVGDSPWSPEALEKSKSFTILQIKALIEYKEKKTENGNKEVLYKQLIRIYSPVRAASPPSSKST